MEIIPSSNNQFIQSRMRLKLGISWTVDTHETQLDGNLKVRNGHLCSSLVRIVYTHNHFSLLISDSVRRPRREGYWLIPCRRLCGPCKLERAISGEQTVPQDHIRLHESMVRRSFPRSPSSNFVLHPPRSPSFELALLPFFEDFYTPIH